MSTEPQQNDLDAQSAQTADVRAPLNYYGQPITPPEHFDGEHVANPGPAGMPPVCACGWTRHYAGGTWWEMSDHLADMRAAHPPLCACGRDIDANGDHDGGYGAFCG